MLTMSQWWLVIIHSQLSRKRLVYGSMFTETFCLYYRVLLTVSVRAINFGTLCIDGIKLFQINEKLLICKNLDLKY